MISPYWKSITALAVGVLAWVGVVLASDSSAITNQEWSQLIASIVVAAGVFRVPNAAKPKP